MGGTTPIGFTNKIMCGLLVIMIGKLKMWQELPTYLTENLSLIH